MREYTVQFHSVNELAQFATIANRQPFPVHFDYQGSRLDAKSILSQNQPKVKGYISIAGAGRPAGAGLL